MITNIMRYYAVIYCIMPATRDRFQPHWILQGDVKNAEKEQICHWVQKKCNTKQYDTAILISWGSHFRTHTNDMDNKSHSFKPNTGVESLIAKTLCL